MSDKVCIECEHYRQDRMCDSPADQEKIDPISGVLEKKLRSCHEERKVIFGFLAPVFRMCGPQGRYWKSKDRGDQR